MNIEVSKAFIYRVILSSHAHGSHTLEISQTHNAYMLVLLGKACIEEEEETKR